jgi:hypothetical protein
MPEQKKSVPIYLSEEYRNSLGRLVDLTDAQMDKLRKRVKADYDDWKSNTSELHASLRRWNDLVEGVMEETDSPFEGASNLHIPLIAIYMKVYHSILRRSILASESIWYAETDDEAMDDFAADIEENLNYKARAKWNIAEAISDVIWTTERDTLGILHIPYVEEYEENVKDIIYVHSMEDFLEEFPPEDPGLSQAEWQSWANLVQAEATEENPVEIPIVYDKEIYRGPKGEIVELADFVIFPATAKSLSKADCHGFGHRFWWRREMVHEKRREGVWYEDAVEKFLEKTKKGSNVSDYMRSKDEIEGLSRSSKSNQYEFVSLIYRIRFKGDKSERKFLLVYAPDCDLIMAVVDFPYRRDHYAIFRIGKKANRLLGDGIPKDLEDLNEEVDAQHNQRINSRKISEVPSFKAKKNASKDFDPNAYENTWKPGVVFWLDDPEAFDQFKVQPADFMSSMREEQNTIQLASLHEGVEPFAFSGNPTPGDADAPGNKTVALIQQSNLRMDDPLAELRHGVEDVGDICLSHEYQFGPAQVTFMRSADGGKRERKSFPKRILRRGINMKMFGITVRLNPDAEFQKWFQYYAVLSKDPIIGQRAKSRWYMLMQALKNGRVEGREKILPSLKELQAEEVEMRKQAMMKMAQEQQAAQAKAMEEQKKEAIQGLQENLKVRNTMAKLATPPALPAPVMQ